VSADLAILVPVLARPGNVAPLMESIRATTPDARTIFICDPDDLYEQRAVLDARAEFFVIAGSYARKVNGAIAGTQEPLILTAADDVRPHPGWLEAAKAKLDQGFEVVGINDLLDRRARPEHATHFLVTRGYAQQGQIDGEPGLLHEGYSHERIDDELIATATKRGVYCYAPDAVVEHRHWLNGGAPMDATYERGMARRARDRRLFLRRQRLWA